MTEDFRKRLETIFHEEASDHLQHLGSGLIAWEKSGEDASSPLPESLYRASHSLKGAARAVGYLEMEALCQALEGAFAALRSGRQALTAEIFDVFNGARAQLERMLSARRRAQAPLAPEAALVQALRAMDEGRYDGAAILRPGQEAIPAREPAKAAPDAPAPEAVRQEAAPLGEGNPAGNRIRVRIPVEKLDALVEKLDDLVAAKSSSVRLLSLLDEVQQAAAHLFAKLGRGADPDSGDRETVRLAGDLESLARKARRMGRENGAQLDQVAAALAAGVRDALMIPLGEILEVFPKIARDLAVETGKRVHVSLSGADREMEKALVEQLREVLLHLVRNALDHGIETPEERLAAGKPAQGHLAISVTLAPGGRIAIEVRDDGRGLDREALRLSAAGLGLLTADGAAALTDSQALELAFRTGLSTRGAVSALSGRGLGLAIVRERIESLGGAVSLESSPGMGARILMTLPSRRTTARGVVVEAGGRVLVIPTSAVKRVLRNQPGRRTSEKSAAAEKPAGKAPDAMHVDGDWLESVALTGYLGLPEKASRPDPGRAAVLIVEAGGSRKAFSVDAVVGEQEIVVQPLGAPLEKVAHVTGAAQLVSGEHALVLDLGAPGISGQSSRSAAAGVPVPGPRKILVVEDSITSRTLIKSLLETAGYSVLLAVDGLAAWSLLEKAAEATVDAVVSDVEMPRMDGFDLLARIRGSGKWRTLPVVLLTSLSSAGERARGLALGANGYMTKGEFDAGQLLRLLGSGG